MQPGRSISILTVYMAILFAFPTSAAPLHLRQDGGNIQGPQTATTVTTTQTPMGLLTETCTHQLKPININGQDLVEDVKQCTISVSNTADLKNGDQPGFGTAPASSSSATSTISASLSNSNTISFSSAAVTPLASVGPAIITGGLSTVARPSSTARPSSSGSAATGSSSGTATATATGISSAVTGSSSAVSGTSSTATASGTRESSNATSAAQNFTLPGQTMPVLPIGLGIFAGITVIALIVVGLVTYERTKYRKAFRARQAAERGMA